MFVKKTVMKYLIYFYLLTCGMVMGQNSSSIEKPHLENRNEIFIGSNISGYNSMTEIGYEFQSSDHFSLVASATISLFPDDFYYNDDLEKNKFGLNLKGRYYFKYFITHSLFYLFFDNNIKVRHFTEGVLGYGYNSRMISYRYLDNNNDYVLDRKKTNENNVMLSAGVGTKYLLDKKFSFDYSFGIGNHIFSKKTDTVFGYFKMGVGYRF